MKLNPKYLREYDLIQKTGNSPITGKMIRAVLKDLGIEQGCRLMMHCSLRSIGWHVGGSRMLLEAVMNQIGEKGLLLMPAHSNDCSDPEDWGNPPVPDAWKPIIRKEMPPFDPNRTSALRVGATAELFRTLPGVHRSSHPLLSVAAWGNGAREITADHALDYPNGMASPLARLYEHGAVILLYGVTYANCTMLHLAEYRAQWPGKKAIVIKAPVSRVNGNTHWEELKDYDYDMDDFMNIGTAMEEQGVSWIRQKNLGIGTLRAINCREFVDFAVGWMEEHRDETGFPL